MATGWMPGHCRVHKPRQWTTEKKLFFRPSPCPPRQPRPCPPRQHRPCPPRQPRPCPHRQPHLCPPRQPRP